jgi:carbamoyltransferase
MFILGVNISHHPSIALLEDGELIYYMEDDRYNGRKEEEWLPKSMMRCLLDILKYTRHLDHITFSSYGKVNGLHVYDYCDDDIIKDVKTNLTQYGITFEDSHYYWEHHLYHACSAFYSSGFDEAAALVLDGGGHYFNDYITLRESESMYQFSGGQIETIKKVYTPQGECFKLKSKPVIVDDKYVLSTTASCGWIFNSIMQITGIMSAGKLMGISPYGDADKACTSDWFMYDEETDTWITDNETILNSYRHCYNNPTLDPSEYHTPEFNFDVIANLSKKAQDETRKHTIRLIQSLLDKVETNNVVLSGGYFLNCVNNYEYAKAFPQINFYIDPTAHDGGTAIGAANYLWYHVLNNEQKTTLTSN